MAFPKHNCTTKAQVEAIYGKSPIVRKLDGWDAKVKILGNPLSTSFEKDNLLSLKVPGVWAEGKSEATLQVNKAIAHLVKAVFEEIQALKLGYTLVNSGAYAFRYNTSMMPGLEGRSEYAGVTGGDPRFAYAAKDRKDGSFEQVVNWVDKNKKNRSNTKKGMLSNHAFGNAIDLNYPTNPMKAGADFDMPKEIVEVFAKYGFDWGGYYHDYTHFEYMLDHVLGAATPPVAPPGSTPPQPAKPAPSTNAPSAAPAKPAAPSAAPSVSIFPDLGIGALLQYASNAGHALVDQWNDYWKAREESQILTAYDAVMEERGYFPIGLNMTWHGGMHLFQATEDPTVRSMLEGTVVAARLPDHDPASPQYGSRNFVLVKHATRTGKPFWSLVMHLCPVLLQPDNPSFANAFPWLMKQSLKRIGEGGTNLRREPDATHGEILRTTVPGEEFEVFGQRMVGTQKWIQVKSKKDGETGWVALLASKFEYKQEIENLADLKAGKVVKLNRPIRNNECLGFYPRASAHPGGKPFIHWEVFSDQVVSDQWVQVKDEDNDIVCDNEAFKKLLNKGQDVWFFDKLTPEDIDQAYRDPKLIQEMWKRAFYFRSEWSVEWKTALEKLDDDFEVEKLAPRLQVYSFWKDAEALGCDLPKGGKVWHYDPCMFIVKEFPLPKPVEPEPTEPSHPPLLDGEYQYKNKDGGVTVEKWTISDEEFLDKDSLTQEQITTICNGKNPELVKRGFDVGIYSFSQREGINPKVILATLAGEQGWCKNGRYDKAFGVGPGGNPQSFGADGGMPKAVKTYLKHFNIARDTLAKTGDLAPMLINRDPKSAGYPESKAVFGAGLADWQSKHPQYVQYMENGIRLKPLNAAMYAKLKYTPWTDFPPQGSHALATWHKYFRSF